MDFDFRHVIHHHFKSASAYSATAAPNVGTDRSLSLRVRRRNQQDDREQAKLPDSHKNIPLAVSTNPLPRRCTPRHDSTNFLLLFAGLPLEPFHQRPHFDGQSIRMPLHVDRPSPEIERHSPHKPAIRGQRRSARSTRERKRRRKFECIKRAARQ